METTNPPRSLEAVRRELTVPLTRADQRRARRDRDSFEWHVIMARGASVFGLALIGIGLARKRGWRVLNWAALACLVWWGVIVAAITVYGRMFVYAAADRPSLVDIRSGHLRGRNAGAAGQSA